MTCGTSVAASRCTGQCCARFTVNLDGLTDPEKNVQDGDYIRDMIVLVEPDERCEGCWVVTCRHFNGADCTAYEDRPWMCSAYPYGSRCSRDGCTYDGVGSPP